MSQQYNRIFITLKNDRQGYGLANRTPSGRCIIETKGKIGKMTLIVQDLKPHVLYKAYAVSGKEHNASGVPFGTVVVDTKGKGELKVEFDCENICGSGLHIDDVNTIAVLVINVNEPDIVASLVGYRNGLVNWKNQFIDCSGQLRLQPDGPPAETTVVPVASPPVETPVEVESYVKQQNVEAELCVEQRLIEPAPCIKPEPVETEPCVEPQSVERTPSVSLPAHHVPTLQAESNDIADADITYKAVAEEADFIAAYEPMENKAAKSENDESTLADIHDAFKSLAQKFNEELEALEQYTFLSDTEKTPVGDVSGEGAMTPKASEYVPEKPVYPIRDEIEHIFHNNAELTPFKRQSKPVRWVRISLKELALLPMDAWSFMNHPFIVFAYKHYNHLILGRTAENGNSVYYVGVPAQYESAFRQTAVRLGFRQFKCCDDTSEQDGAYGYWLLKIEN